MSLYGRAEQIEEEASHWLARRVDGELSAQQEQEFSSWVAAATAHRIAYLRLETAWHRGEVLRDRGMAAPSSINPSPFATLETPPSRPRAKSRNWVLGLAASVSAVAVCLAWFFRPPGGTVYTTAVGQTVPLTLQDGTQVTLDTQTQIRVTSSDRLRRAQLLKGEAVFTIAKDATRPFVVDIGPYRVRDIGTKFALGLSEQGGVHLSVLEGRVVIEGSGLTGQREITAGSQADISDGQISTHPVTEDDTARQMAWTQGFLEFKDSPLSQAVAQFNRYHEEQLVLEDPSLESIRVGGRFKYSDLDGFIAVLEQTFSVTASRDHALIHLRHR